MTGRKRQDFTLVAESPTGCHTAFTGNYSGNLSNRIGHAVLDLFDNPGVKRIVISQVLNSADMMTRRPTILMDKE